MSVVLTEPDGFAIDWDWQRCLTVWAVRGDRFGDKITEHQLGTRPGSEFRPAARPAGGGAGRDAARHWGGRAVRPQVPARGHDTDRTGVPEGRISYQRPPSMSSAWPAASPDRVSPAQLYGGHPWRVMTRPPTGSGPEPDSAARTPAPAFDVIPAGSMTGGLAAAHPFVHVTFLRSDRGDHVQRVAPGGDKHGAGAQQEGVAITGGAAWAALCPAGEVAHPARSAPKPARSAASRRGVISRAPCGGQRSCG